MIEQRDTPEARIPAHLEELNEEETFEVGIGLARAVRAQEDGHFELAGAVDGGRFAR